MSNPLRDPRDRRIPRVAEPSVVIMFGVTGDLARKKLLPAIYDLANRGLLPPGFSLIGFARRDWNDQDFATHAYDAVREHARTTFRDSVWQQVSDGLRFVSGEFSDDEAFDRLAQVATELDAERGTSGNRAFYLSIPPGQFPVVVRQLERSGLSDCKDGHGWKRVVIEKPFGHDLTSARDLNQNHLLQLLALTAMEEPVSFASDALRAEKQKALSAVQIPADPLTGTARGQYAAGWQGGIPVHGFLAEDGIAPDSVTETYAAIRLGVDTRRWAGVPFYLRTGKRLATRLTELAVIFQRAPHLPFNATDAKELGQNALVIRVQPDEGITMRFGSKVPGSAMEVRDVNMDFAYGESFTESSPEAYERLLLDVLVGDPPLFPGHEEVELSWKILDPIEEFWAANGRPEPYLAGTAGPACADAMMARDGRAWRRL